MTIFANLFHYEKVSLICNVQHHSNNTGCSAIYSPESSRERSRAMKLHHGCVSGDDLCESFPFITSIEKCNLQHHSKKLKLLITSINFSYSNLFNKGKYRVAVYKKVVRNCPINTLTSTASFIFILLNINCFLNK